MIYNTNKNNNIQECKTVSDFYENELRVESMQCGIHYSQYPDRERNS